MPPYFTGKPPCAGCTALPPAYVSPGTGYRAHPRGGLAG
jgi:hypothetical protein